MIVQPQVLSFENKKFSMIIAGSPGIGKTTLALSAPNPILIDFDRGIGRVKAQYRRLTDVIDDYEELLEDMNSEEFKQAETVIIDTGGSFVTYLQDWAMRQNPLNRQKNGAISLKGFGAVKGEFIRFTNAMKDTMHKNVIYVFHTQEEKNTEGNAVQRLQCEGSARNIVWQPCDLGAYMRMLGNKRQLCFTPTDEYFAKGCFDITGVIDVPELNGNAPNDFITKLYEKARQNIEEEKEYFIEQHDKYQDIMNEGLALVEGIIDAKTCEKATNEIKKLPEALTSKTELNAAFKSKITEVGLKWNKETRRYE